MFVFQRSTGPVTLVREVAKREERDDRRAGKVHDEQRRADTAIDVRRGTGECGLEYPRDSKEYPEGDQRGPAPRSEEVREDRSDAGPGGDRRTVREPAQAPL